MEPLFHSIDEAIEWVKRFNEYASVNEVLIEFAHVSQEFSARHEPGFRVLCRFNDNHETHGWFSLCSG